MDPLVDRFWNSAIEAHTHAMKHVYVQHLLAHVLNMCMRVRICVSLCRCPFCLCLSVCVCQLFFVFSSSFLSQVSESEVAVCTLQSEHISTATKGPRMSFSLAQSTAWTSLWVRTVWSISDHHCRHCKNENRNTENKEQPMYHPSPGQGMTLLHEHCT